MNGSSVYMIPCVICGSPVFTGNTRRSYCDSSTGPDCMRIVRNYQKSKEYRLCKDTEKYNVEDSL
jgi:hypothetical protein